MKTNFTNKEKFENFITNKMAELNKEEATARKTGKKAAQKLAQEKLNLLYDIIDEFKDIYK